MQINMRLNTPSQVILAGDSSASDLVSGGMSIDNQSGIAIDNQAGVEIEDQ